MKKHHSFLVEPASSFPKSEADNAKQYWSSVGVRRFYRQAGRHWSNFMAQQVLSFKPRSVLEFGCNVGQNLLSIRELDPTLSTQGVDVNATAVAFGRAEAGLNLIEGDETFLSSKQDGAFDVVFTVSVLDHLPQPKPVLSELVRLARLAVLLLEPTLPEQGKIIRNRSPDNGEMLDTTPYSYSWDYKALCADLPVEVSMEPYPLEGTNLGPYYCLFRLLKR